MTQTKWFEKYSDGRDPPAWYIEMVMTGVVPKFAYEGSLIKVTLLEFVHVYLLATKGLHPMFYTLPFTMGKLSINDEFDGFQGLTTLDEIIGFKRVDFYTALLVAGLVSKSIEVAFEDGDRCYREYMIHKRATAAKAAAEDKRKREVYWVAVSTSVPSMY